VGAPRVGYPGLVLATGLGALLLLDLSANGHPGNRYLALYHQGHLWLGMLVFSLVLFLRQPFSRAVGFALSLLGEAARGVTRALGRPAALAGLILVALTGVLAFGVALSSMRQLTSELGRVWLIVGAAWFFFLRAAPLAERLARSGTASVSFWRYLGPLLFVVGMLVAVMVITRDMGPLLIAGYACGAFVAASVALWSHLRFGHRGWAMLLSVLLFGVWIIGVTAALFALGTVDSVTAMRLESLTAPYASVNDQSALVSWFQRATPPGGFGLGTVPWCGYAPVGSCSGVPAQIHSDYTFTAIHGVFGQAAAWAASLGCALWLHRLIRHHGRVTRGEPGYVAAGSGRMLHDDQALLSWIGVAWVALTFCQLAVTVAGNLAVLPLTGVTFPFVSFGMTSLVVNLTFLALCINVDLPPRGSRG
jgi:cell division protein FtsW (lipid II flippase)